MEELNKWKGREEEEMKQQRLGSVKKGAKRGSNQRSGKKLEFYYFQPLGSLTITKDAHTEALEIKTTH